MSFLMYDEEAAATRAQGDSRADRGRLGRYLDAPQREVEVIRSLSLSVHEGEIVAVVGASGSGKTLLADAVLGLFESNALVRGRIWFDGRPMDAAALAAERGRGIALVPQSVASLDPLMRVGRQVEGMPRGRGAARRADAARRRARRAELFARYGLAEEVARLYPHELSGGMARRVLLCCALMDAPKLIIADEPTPGLDLSLAQAALADFRAFADAGGGVMLITHDIELALTVADRVAVFRDGTVVEETSVAAFASPDTLGHPFTASALARPARARICRAPPKEVRYVRRPAHSPYGLRRSSRSTMTSPSPLPPASACSWPRLPAPVRRRSAALLAGYLRAPDGRGARRWLPAAEAWPVPGAAHRAASGADVGSAHAHGGESRRMRRK